MRSTQAFSRKEGAVDNWLYYEVVLKARSGSLGPRFAKRPPLYVGILHGDVFPFRPVDLRSYLDERNMYGVVHGLESRGHLSKYHERGYFLHPQLLFYRVDYMMQFKPDFRPGSGFDTGGMMFETLPRCSPHLHYATYFHGVPVDPDLLLNMPKEWVPDVWK